MRIVDSHAHLESEDFDSDRAEMLARAHAEGVEAILAIGSGGSGPDNLGAAINVAKDYDWIYASIGIHPQHAADAREKHYPQLAALALNPKVIAWGEIGLDYHWPEPAREVQHEVFRRQLELAREANLPIVIHCRDAWERLPGDIGDRVGAVWPGRHPALLHRHARRRPPGPRDGLHGFVRGQRHLPKDAAASRRGERVAARANANRNRLAVPAAAKASRKTKRAG